MKYTVLRYGTIDSTNRLLLAHAQPDGETMTVAVADYQTAGRGQGHNTWESEKGKNLLFSVLLRPTNIAADRQFVISMAAALAHKEALDAYAEGITLKWPNDIYWQDRKLGGTLIETRLCGATITHCVVGTGINVNQRTFRSDAPNPVSLLNITGRETCRDALLGEVLEALSRYMDMAESGEDGIETISQRYHAALYRRKGMHEYEDLHGRFLAKIAGVEPAGHLLLRLANGTVRRYAFKEVKFII